MQATGGVVDLTVAAQEDIERLCNHGDVERARSVIASMQARGEGLSAATYLPLFKALGKITRNPRVDRMQDLLYEMEGQGIHPSAEVRRAGG
jgi:pentatricopeptide repeat protein